MEDTRKRFNKEQLEQRMTFEILFLGCASCTGKGCEPVSNTHMIGVGGWGLL